MEAQLREALAGLHMAIAALQQERAYNSSLKADNQKLRSELVRANATILHQDEELAEWEHGKRTPVQGASKTMPEAPSKATAKATAKAPQILDSVPAPILAPVPTYLPALTRLAIGGAVFNCKRPERTSPESN